jgi:hypothetical protein
MSVLPREPRIYLLSSSKARLKSFFEESGKLIDMQSIPGLTSEQRNTLSRTDFTTSGTGSMTEHGIPSVE